MIEMALSSLEEQRSAVVCPACGHRFGLDEKVVDHFHRQWERDLRKTVKAELRVEMAPEVEKQAQRLATQELRSKDEEVRERDQQINRLQRQIKSLSRKLPVPRAQALGELREGTLAQALMSRCAHDEIAAVAKGARGADLIQSVRDPAGRICGTILWESKRASNWSNAWIPKLREDQRRGDHTIGVIVSDVLPDPERSLMDVSGVWVTTIETASDLAAILRDTVIQVAGARAARAQRDDLKGLAYDYLSGAEFAARVRSIIETAQTMRASLDLERRALQVRWSERDKHIDTVVGELAGMYGDLRGLGTALPTIDTLELPAPSTA